MTQVKVSGKGKAKGQPDVAIIQVAIKNEDKNQLECRRINNVGSESVISILKGVVEENDIHVTPANVTTRYKSGLIRSAIHHGHNKITATIRNLDIVQELIVKINGLDEELVQISSLEFDIEDKEELENKARCEAFANAKRRAEIYGEQIDLSINEIESISEHLNFGGSARHPSGKFSLRDVNEFISLGRSEYEHGEEVLEMGDVELSVDVDVVFQLGGCLTIDL